MLEPHAARCDSRLDARFSQPLETDRVGLGAVVFSRLFWNSDSERADVRYENWRGHKLDRKMLELLRES